MGREGHGHWKDVCTPWSSLKLAHTALIAAASCMCWADKLLGVSHVVSFCAVETSVLFARSFLVHFKDICAVSHASLCTFTLLLLCNRMRNLHVYVLNTMS